MTRDEQWTLKAMTTFGGGFVKALAQAAHQADPINLERLKQAFPEYWKKYTDMGISLHGRKP